MRALVIAFNLLFVGAIIWAAANFSYTHDASQILIIVISLFGLIFGNWLAYKKVNSGGPPS